MLGKMGFRFFVFPFYRLLYLFKYKALNVYAPAKNRMSYVLNKTYLIHVAIVLIGVVVTWNSIMAKDLREENFGEQTVIYSVISKEELEVLTEETQLDSSSGKILSYLDKSATMESQKIITDAPSASSDQLATEFSTVTEGGAAVVKPNILGEVKPEDLPGAGVPSRQGITTYVVQAGETVSAIAEKYNISVDTILWQNNLSVRSLIRAGDKLEILPTSGVLHTVTSGETVGAIAKKYSVEVEKIISFNNLFDVNDIKKGQKLIVPGGKIVAPYIAPSQYAQVPQVSPISKLFIPPAQQIQTSGMLWPTSVRRISQYYSWRHTAIDIAGPTGTPIYASDSGTVIFAGWSTGYGNNILIDHGGGMQTRYAHASKLYVGKGDAVVKGQTIMAMGSTGWSTGPHVHFEIIVNGVKKNPLSYVK